MKYSDIPLAQMVVAYMKASNIRHVVISPGSRNAPLTVGFTYNNFFKCYSIVDERCAAFFALGIAQQLQQPVALVCTSGSALLNYYPAISEAYFSHIPLVVLSADRPEDRIGIGDGQTIFQEGVYGKHIAAEANLKTGDAPDIQEQNQELLNKALEVCFSAQRPIHVNIPFNEPLYGITDTSLFESVSISSPSEQDLPSEVITSDFISSWNSSKKKMILVGVLPPEELSPELISLFEKDNSLVVFTETTSNLVSQEFFPSIDQIIAPLDQEGFEALQPDMLITLGGLVVSKKIKSFLRKYPAKSHWHIGSNEANDTFFYLTEHVKLNPDDWFKSQMEQLAIDESATYRTKWKHVKTHRISGHNAYMKEIPFSDLKVFSYINKYMPKAINVQMGNSSTIRYAQLFSWSADVKMFCNRGTSGIDGSTSTAIGAAVASESSTVFVTGDLSFFYDSNALWNNYIPKDFKIILINNSGGGIFRILPGHKNTENFDTYFETRHNLDAQHLALMYNFKYASANDESSLEAGLETLFSEQEQPFILEVFTPAHLNDDILLSYFDYIK